MNQPTEERIRHLEEEQKRLREEHEMLKRQLREQRTEEMRAINVNVASQDVITRLDKLEQDLQSHSEVWLNTLQEHYDEHKHDISNVQQAISDVQTVQKGHSKFFEEHGKRLAATATKEDLGQLRSEMATKDDITRLEGLIMQLIQQKP